jgi:DinB family protein
MRESSMMDDVFRILSTTPEKLKREVAGMSLRELKKRPRPGKWSVQIILAHLNDLEDHYRRNRVQAMLQLDSPRLVPFDQEKRAAEMHYDRADPHRTFAQFARRRRANLRLLCSITTAQWKRAGIHPAAGKIRLQELVTEWAFHDLGHIRQIMEIKRFALYPRMGNMRKFYQFG